MVKATLGRPQRVKSHAHTCARTHTHTHMLSRAHTCSLSPTHICMHTCKHTHICTSTREVQTHSLLAFSFSFFPFFETGSSYVTLVTWNLLWRPGYLGLNSQRSTFFSLPSTRVKDVGHAQPPASSPPGHFYFIKNLYFFSQVMMTHTFSSSSLEAEAGVSL